VAINGYFIDDYFILNYHKILVFILLMVIGGLIIIGYCGYCWLFCCKPLVVILLVAIDGYLINGY
jgi:hypothetical protein